MATERERKNEVWEKRECDDGEEANEAQIKPDEQQAAATNREKTKIKKGWPLKFFKKKNQEGYM